MMTFAYISRAVSAITGGILVYIALFMYKDDFGKVQNFLVQLWNKIDDLARSTPSKTATLIKVLADLVSSMFDRIFGPKVISLRAAAVSGALSLSPVYIVRAYRQLGHDPVLGPQFVLATCFLILPLILLWLTKISYDIEAVVMFLCVIDLTLLLFLASEEHAFGILSLCLCFAVASDFGLIALNRHGLRWCSGEDSPTKMLVLLGVNICLAVVACILPWLAGAVFEQQYHEALADPSEQYLQVHLADSFVDTKIESLRPLVKDFDDLRNNIRVAWKEENLYSNSFEYQFDSISYRSRIFVRLCETTYNDDYQSVYKEEVLTVSSTLPGNLTKAQLAEYEKRAKQKAEKRQDLRVNTCNPKNDIAKLAEIISSIEKAIAELRKDILATEKKQQRIRIYPVAAANAQLMVLTNLDTLAMSVLLIAGIFGMITHRLFWPILARPLCALAELGMLKSRALLGLIGSSLLGATPFWEKIFELFKG